MDGNKMITRIFWAVIIIGIIAIGAHVHDSKDTEKPVASEPDTPQTTWYDLMLNHKVDTFIDPTIACPTSSSRSSYVSQSSPSGDSYDAGYDAGFEDGYAAGVANNSFGVGYDDANEFSDEDATRFCDGYEAGYESGFSEGLAHYNDEKQKESLRTRSFFHHNHYPDSWDEE